MIKLASIGECMLELSQTSSKDQFRLGFAGDTYNTAVYCRRCADPDQISVDYVTAVGDDPFSQEMLQSMRSEQIGIDNVQISEARQTGLYLIRTSEQGERQFYYYRSEAPVRDLFAEISWQSLLVYDVFYLSGITLAVLHNESREKLFELLAEARKQGKEVIFDNNYRPKLWPSDKEAKHNYQKIYSYTTIALPSYEDALSLFGNYPIEELAEKLLNAGVREVVVKQGAKNLYLANSDEQHLIGIESVLKVIDTTAAGDSFNGGYLAKRLTGSTMLQAANYAAKVASVVIQHHGAIIDKDIDW